jgi:hypothetical protein
MTVLDALVSNETTRSHHRLCCPLAAKLSVTAALPSDDDVTLQVMPSFALESAIPIAPSHGEGDQTDDQVYFVLSHYRWLCFGSLLPLIFSRIAENLTSAGLTLNIGRIVLRTAS